MAEKKQFKWKSIQDSKTIATYLNSLVRGFESGKIHLKSDEEGLCLHPPELMEMTVKADAKPGKSKLTVKVAWHEADPDPKGEESISIGT